MCQCVSNLMSCFLKKGSNITNKFLVYESILGFVAEELFFLSSHNVQVRIAQTIDLQ